MSSNSRPPTAAYPFCEREAGESVSDEQQQRQTQHEEIDAERGLRLLKMELDSMPDNMKTSFVHAQHVAPDLVCDQRLSQFLHAEEYNVKVRYCENKRFHIVVLFLCVS